MGFFDNVKSRFKNNEEEEFERSFREGAWPEGVSDFAPLSNTGSFLPTTFDVDPLADPNLPGNVAQEPADGSFDQPAMAGEPLRPVRTDSVIRTTPAEIYGNPAAPRPFQVIGAEQKPRLVGEAPRPVPQEPAPERRSVAPAPMAPAPAPVAPAPVERRPVDRRPVDRGPVESNPGQAHGYSYDTPYHDLDDTGVQVVPRAEKASSDARRTSSSGGAVIQKPYADRLRERVEASNREQERDDMRDRDRDSSYGSSTRRSPSREGVRPEADYDDRRPMRDADYDDRRPVRDDDYDDRRSPRDDDRPSARPSYDRPASHASRPSEGRPSVERFEPRAFSSAPRTLPTRCTVFRPRSYDDVAEIARVVVAERRPAVLYLSGCLNDLSRRVVDFSLGVSMASETAFTQIGDHAYALIPKGTSLSDEDMQAMRRQGIVR